MLLFERNLAALRGQFPQLADTLAQTPIPADYQPVAGLDGTPTYARTVTEPAKRIGWLGATSTPAAAASAIIHALDPGTTSGLGLTLGTGHAWLALLGRLARHQALFVYEPELGLARMALAVTDLSAPLAMGKLILLVGPADLASEDLSRFLQRHPGYEPPTVLHPLATIPAASRNALLAVGEALVRRVVLERQRVVSELAGRIPPPAEKTAATLALVLTPRHAFDRTLLRSLPPGTPVQYVDDHRSCSLALRLGSLIEHRPGRIVSDLFRAQLEPIPAHIPVETWVPPTVGAGYWQPERLPRPDQLAADDRVVVHFEDHRSLLKNHGIAESQILLRPLRPRGFGSANSGFGLRHRVALIADLPTIDAEAIGFRLPTQLAVYGAARQILEDDFLSAHPGNVQDVFRRALLRAGISPAAGENADPAFIGPMLRAIRQVLLSSIPVLSLARMLAEQQIPLKLVGDWELALRHFALPTSAYTRAPFPASEDTRETFAEVAIVVHLAPTGAFSPLELAAAAQGVALVAPEHPTDALAGSLSQVIRPNTGFVQVRSNQLVPTIKSLLRDGSKRAALAASCAHELKADAEG